jgi:DNA polymerase-3 subunit epsilon
MTTNDETTIPRKQYALVFDTETTGLIPRKPKNSLDPIPLTEYPHITQLSFVLYDLTNHNLISIYDSYVKINENVVISEFSKNLTKITHEICQTKGRDIVDVLIDFYEAYKYADYIIAHNIDFDEEMILIELKRNHQEILIRYPVCFTLFNKTYERIANVQRFCTMRKGINLCNILTTSEEGKPPRKKWPKLIELHQKLFNGESVEGLHDSMVDVMTCLKCYIKMKEIGIN